MAQPSTSAGRGAGGSAACAAPVGVRDVMACVGQGVRDYAAAPGLSFALGSIYALAGWLLAVLLVRARLPYLVYPLAMGFALIAPFVAVMFYAVSRDLGAGVTPTLRRVLAATWDARRRDVRWMALITAFAFFIWMDIAAMITLAFFGAAALELELVVREIVSTLDGLVFLLVGHAVGAVIAFLVFSISVVTFPMLFDRDVDVVTAIAASLALVRSSPVAMVLWCATIVGALFASVGTMLLVLPLVLPVIGYASWHLYRRVAGGG